MAGVHCYKKKRQDRDLAIGDKNLGGNTNVRDTLATYGLGGGYIKVLRCNVVVASNVEVFYSEGYGSYVLKDFLRLRPSYSL